MITTITLGVLLFMGAMAFASGFWSYRNRPSDRKEWWSNLWQGICTELIGAIITALLFTVLLGAVERQAEQTRRLAEQQQAEADLKAQLIRQMGSRDNSTALYVAGELAAKGWLYDGSLQGAHLIGADLQDAELVAANLEGAVLVGANLQDVDLWNANLQGADLWNANLQGVKLAGANLQGANLRNANLQGADLWEANLQGADLYHTQFDENTILPDAVWNNETGAPEGNWTPDTDMERFTNPEHPDFWRSD